MKAFEIYNMNLIMSSILFLERKYDRAI